MAPRVRSRRKSMLLALVLAMALSRAKCVGGNIGIIHRLCGGDLFGVQDYWTSFAGALLSYITFKCMLACMMSGQMPVV